MFRALIFSILLSTTVLARPNDWLEDDDDDDRLAHSYINDPDHNPNDYAYDSAETTADFWRQKAQASLADKISTTPITGVAKNVILFMGDGMSIPTLAAARVYLGQINNKRGEESELSFEKFPYVGLSKTYCVNRQVADSACSATAYLCGVKANEGTVGVTAAVKKSDCQAMQNTTNHVFSIARWSQLQGKRTGVITTTRVTHASPSGAYAHTAHRHWESDADVIAAGQDPKACPDIAHQLVHGVTGRNLNVIMGGGRGKFIPTTTTDEEGKTGYRLDNRDLIQEWLELKGDAAASYVENRNELMNLPSNTDYLLGLFRKDHMDYNIDRDPTKKPSLAEMTQKSIEVLSRGSNGFFLFVEGGRIDHAHHNTKARKALDETVEFQKAIQAAVDMTNEEETLIVVTSDHAHTMSLNGYPARGNDILGIAGNGDDNIPYTTLSYANGPGYRQEQDGKRHDPSKDDLSDPEYEYPSLVPRYSETHGGDDVAIFARGPWAHLFTGVNEENVIPHVMAYASCVGDGNTVCSKRK